MKLLVVLCVLSLLAMSYSKPQGTSLDRCIYVLGKCVRVCEEGTHAYYIGCDRKIPEATCLEPNPVEEDASLCDYSTCYCDPPMVRDVVSDKYVRLENCPKE